MVHNALVGAGLRDRIRIGASGKVATGSDIVKRLAQGADYTNAARAMMMAVGCIQSQRCHTNNCPVGVATQDPKGPRARRAGQDRAGPPLPAGHRRRGDAVDRLDGPRRPAPVASPPRHAPRRPHDHAVIRRALRLARARRAARRAAAQDWALDWQRARHRSPFRTPELRTTEGRRMTTVAELIVDALAGLGVTTSGAWSATP